MASQRFTQVVTNSVVAYAEGSLFVCQAPAGSQSDLNGDHRADQAAIWRLHRAIQAGPIRDSTPRRRHTDTAPKIALRGWSTSVTPIAAPRRSVNVNSAR